MFSACPSVCPVLVKVISRKDFDFLIYSSPLSKDDLVRL